MNTRHRIIYWVVGLVTLLIAVVFAISPSSAFFNSTSFCKHCGARKSTQKAFWINYSTISPTLLSTAADELKLIDQNHTHEWLFAHGAGGDITCAIGSGRHLFSAIDNPYLVECLSRIQQSRGNSYAEDVLHRALDPFESSAISATFGSMDIIDYPDDNSFQSWFDEQVIQMKEVYDVDIPLDKKR